MTFGRRIVCDDYVGGLNPICPSLGRITLGGHIPVFICIALTSLLYQLSEHCLGLALLRRASSFALAQMWKASIEHACDSVRLSALVLHSYQESVPLLLFSV